MAIVTPPRSAGGVRLVLASSSVYRRALLERLGVPFTCHAPAIDERAVAAESPTALVRRLGLAKARALATTYPHHLIVASDQIAVCAGLIVGKPGDREPAIAQLAAAAGGTVRFLTSVCVFDSSNGRCEVDVVPCDVVFRALTAAQIAAYVDREQPFDCAGSFKAERLGIALCERIEGHDPTALIGLPLITLVSMLARAGCDVLAALP